MSPNSPHPPPKLTTRMGNSQRYLISTTTKFLFTILCVILCLISVPYHSSLVQAFSLPSLRRRSGDSSSATARTTKSLQQQHVTPPKGPLSIHILPHSHIDQGWLQTVDEYQSSVYQILSSVTSQLKNDASRTFTWGEVMYFRRWFESQSSQMQSYLTHLIAEGRFEFVHGGWIENDHASVSYQAIVEQMTLGYEYLKERFGIVPRFGYDIDPFGHSGHVAHLYKQMGIEMLIMNRVHWKIKQLMKKSRNLEFLWKSNSEWKLLTHVLHTHYAAVQGFDFENPGVPSIHQGNVAQRGGLFVQKLRSRAEAYRTNVILVPWGDDFKFRDARRQYSSMDQIITWINDNVQDVHIKYSTVSRYFDEMQEAAQKTQMPFSVIGHDFFPYADNEDSYWTGHFTSLPNLKKNIRRAEAALRTTERLLAQSSVLKPRALQAHSTQWNNQLHSLRDMLAVLYHHDSITGTCRRHVANDYMAKAQRVLDQCEHMQGNLLRILLSDDEHANNAPSYEPTTRTVIKALSTPYTIAVVNPVSSARSELVHLTSYSAQVSVLDSSGTPVPVSVVPRYVREDRLETTFSENARDEPPYHVYFLVQCGPMSTHQYVLHAGETHTPNTPAQVHVFTSQSPQQLTSSVRVDSLSSASSKKKFLAIQNDKYIIRLDPQTGNLASVHDKDAKTTHQFPQGAQFTEFQTKRSGSYIFRPERDAQSISPSNVLKHVVVVRHNLFEEIIAIGTRIRQRVRLQKQLGISNKYIQQTLFIEKLPGDTELMSNYHVADPTSSLITYDGVNFVKRNVRHDAPIAARVYPSPSGAIYRGSQHQITVLTQHAMGVTVSSPSQREGHMGFMVHRRLMKDDGRGMSEGNNDMSTLTVNMLLSYDSVSTVNEEKFLEFHHMSQAWNHPVVSFSETTTQQQTASVLSQPITLLNRADPDLKHIAVINLDQRGTANNELVLRLHNLHASREVTVNLHNLFDPKLISIESVTQTTLNLAYILPQEASIYETYFLEEDHQTVLDFRASVDHGGTNVAQNTEEEGVFLSDAALEHANAGGRKLHGMNLNLPYKIRPAEIATFILELSSRESEIHHQFTKHKMDVKKLIDEPTVVHSHSEEIGELWEDIEDDELDAQLSDLDKKENIAHNSNTAPHEKTPYVVIDQIKKTSLDDSSNEEHTSMPSKTPSIHVSNDDLLDDEHDEIVLNHTFDLYFILLFVCALLCIGIVLYMLKSRLPHFMQAWFEGSSNSIEESLKMEGLKQV